MKLSQEKRDVKYIILNAQSGDEKSQVASKFMEHALSRHFPMYDPDIIFIDKTTTVEALFEKRLKQEYEASQCW